MLHLSMLNSKSALNDVLHKIANEGGDILSFLTATQKECGDIAYLTPLVDAGRMYLLYDVDAIKHVLIDN